MARNRHIVSFRATERLVEDLLRFAMENGLYNAQDQPNISAAVILLISAGFNNPRGQQEMVAAYEVARGTLLDTVKRELNLALENIANRIE